MADPWRDRDACVLGAGNGAPVGCAEGNVGHLHERLAPLACEGVPEV